VADGPPCACHTLGSGAGLFQRRGTGAAAARPQSWAGDFPEAGHNDQAGGEGSRIEAQVETLSAHPSGIRLKDEKATHDPPLAAGQLWQLKNGYVQIGSVAKRLADYKLLRKPGQKAVQCRMGTVASVLDYLKANKAKLVPSPEHRKPPL
jgi:hypothetical protein